MSALPLKTRSVSARTKLSAVTGTTSGVVADFACVAMILLSFGARYLKRCVTSDLLDVRQLPRFLKQRFFRSIETEENFEPSVGARGNPVRFLAGGCLGPEVDIYRTISVRLQSRRMG